MQIVVNLLKELNYTISSCESITGGLFSKEITDIPDASKIFKGSVISYTNEIKIDIVGVKREIIEKFGVVSPECALAMAQNIRKKFKTDIGISFTGNAGPSNSENSPIGLVYLALVFKKYFLIEKLNLQGNREEVRNEVVNQARKILVKNLIKIKKESSK